MDVLKVCAKINNVGLVPVPLTPDFSVRVPEVSHHPCMIPEGDGHTAHTVLCLFQILAAVKPDVKLIFLCSPGNPTAKLIPLEAIEQIAQGGTWAVVTTIGGGETGVL